MQLRTLRIFCDVVQLRSFSRAADENKISQSSASQLVHQLEDRLGVKLIDRSKRPFNLTPEGEVYYAGCRGIVERYVALVDKVRTLHQEVEGRLRVASIYSVGLHHMNRHLLTFMSRYPRANVRLEYLHPHRVHEAVENDQAELGLVSYPKSTRALKAIRWREEPMVIVCRPTDQLSQRSSLRLDDLNGCQMVSFDNGLTIRREIDRALAQHHVQVDTVMEFDNVETIKRAIEIGVGIGLLPEPTVAREVAGGSLVAIPLQDEQWKRPLGIVYRRGKQLSSTALRFIELLQQENGASEMTPSPANGDVRQTVNDAIVGEHDQAKSKDAAGGASGNDRHLTASGFTSDGTPEAART